MMRKVKGACQPRAGWLLVCTRTSSGIRWPVATAVRASQRVEDLEEELRRLRQRMPMLSGQMPAFGGLLRS